MRPPIPEGPKSCINLNLLDKFDYILDASVFLYIYFFSVCPDFLSLKQFKNISSATQQFYFEFRHDLFLLLEEPTVFYFKPLLLLIYSFLRIEILLLNRINLNFIHYKPMMEVLNLFYTLLEELNHS